MSKNDWNNVGYVLPPKGLRVICRLSQDIGFGRTEKILYRMKHNGNWSDYHDLVVAWKYLP